MKIRRLTAFILVFVMCFALVSCNNDGADENSDTTDSQTADADVGTAESSTDDSAEVSEEAESAAESTEETTENTAVSDSDTVAPLLYRVTDDDGDVIWLFGAIHLGREDYYPLPDYVTDAYENADSLAVEADIVAFENDYSLQIRALSSIVYTDGTTIEDHISPELYESAVEILEDFGSYNAALDMYCPFLWSSMIETLMMEDLGAKSELGIDRFFIETAYDDGKELIEIESVEFQYQMMGGFDDEIQTLILEMAVDSCGSYDEAAADIELLLDLWASGDEEDFAEYLSSDSGLTAEEAEIYARYEKEMITDRNLTMTDFAETALEDGKEVFICVGAAHIVGDGAMAELLAQRGYTVKCITG